MISRTLPPLSFTEADLEEARTALTAFVTERAEATAQRLGFGYQPAPDAPNTWADLKTAWQHSLATNAPLQVFDGASGSVIFNEPEANFAFRYWHDVTHLERGRSFSNAHELDMTAYHLQQAEEHGITRGSLAWRLFQADTLGQVLHWAFYRRYVTNQRVFILNCVRYGFPDALLAEASRLALFHPQALPEGIDITTDSAADGPAEPSSWSPPAHAGRTLTGAPHRAAARWHPSPAMRAHAAAAHAPKNKGS